MQGREAMAPGPSADEASAGKDVCLSRCEPWRYCQKDTPNCAGLFSSQRYRCSAAQFASRAGTDLAFLRPSRMSLSERLLCRGIPMIDLLVRGKANSVSNPAGSRPLSPCAATIFRSSPHGNLPRRPNTWKKCQDCSLATGRIANPRNDQRLLRDCLSRGKAFSYLGFTLGGH